MLRRRPYVYFSCSYKMLLSSTSSLNYKMPSGFNQSHLHPAPFQDTSAQITYQLTNVLIIITCLFPLPG